MNKVKGPTEPELLDKTIPQLLEQAAHESPKREALTSLKSETRLNFKQLYRQSKEVARALMAQGLTKGDRVATALPNCTQWITAFFGCSQMGAIPINIAPDSPRERIQYQLNDSGAKCLITNQQIAELTQESNYSPEIIVTISEEKQFLSWESFLARAREVSDHELPEINPEDTMTICYTSGTEGRAKGVVHTHYTILNNADLTSQRFGFSKEHGGALALTVPMFHIFGQLVTLVSLVQEMKLAIPRYLKPKSLLKCIEREQCTSLGTIPDLFKVLVGHSSLEEYDLSSLKHAFSSSDVLSENLARLIYDRLGVNSLQNVWGSTEVLVATLTPQRCPPEKLSSEQTDGSLVGKVMPYYQLKITDDEEILCRGPSVFKRYWNKPGKTERHFENGWYKTGDVGEFHHQWLNFKGRKRAVFEFKRRGEKVYADEVEQKINQVVSSLLEIPDIAIDVAVIEIPSGLSLKEELGAFIKLPEQGFEKLKEIEQGKIEQKWESLEDIKEKIVQQASEKLKSVKVPNCLQFNLNLPRTPGTHKVKRHELAEKAQQGKNLFAELIKTNPLQKNGS